MKDHVKEIIGILVIILLAIIVISIDKNREKRISNNLGISEGEIYEVKKSEGTRVIYYKYKIDNKEYNASTAGPYEICPNPSDCIGRKVKVEYQKDHPSNSRIIINNVAY